MAVDTRQKRFGLINVSMPWRGTSHPLTSGIDADERAVMIFMYGGISLAAAAVVTDLRTIAGRIIVAFTDGDKFRIRAVRTAGGSDLQTAQNGSAIQAMVYWN